MTINQTLKQLRKSRGISQSQMASILNKSQNAYSMMESGRSKIDAALVPDICHAFNISPNELFEYQEADFHQEKNTVYTELIRLLKKELDKKNELLILSLQAMTEFDRVVEKNGNLV
ncbi:MAG TPA: helix-turn-helix transcriptional regulator, partial [Niabella sp.]|nr:helix-turn-helix transcriptional regulator [Niabella sp.]